MGAEQSDDDLLEAGETDRVVAELDVRESALALFIPDLGPMVCEAAETGGADQVHRVFTSGVGCVPAVGPCTYQTVGERAHDRSRIAGCRGGHWPPSDGSTTGAFALGKSPEQVPLWGAYSLTAPEGTYRRAVWWLAWAISRTATS